jgi:RNA 3'-terminal phosphate cyclase (ATP)
MADPDPSGPVVLDGSEGEGGGQILRSALSLSLITGRPFEIRQIRARRKPPGLRPQHLACVRGAEAISGGTSEGAEVGASELRFSPQPVKAGSYLLEVGTAGSTPLLFQCLFFPLALAGGGELTLRGGTHLPHSPIYHYLVWVWLPAMQAFGLRAELHLKSCGFYPQGGGEFRAAVPAPAEPPTLVDIPARGTLRDVELTSFVAGLPLQVAERQASSAQAALRENGILADAENLPLPGPGKGTAVFIRAHFENSVAGFTGLGERGKPAEAVGREAAQEMAAFMESPGAVDEHLADQILLPAALLAAGKLGPVRPATTHFTTANVTDHLTTNASVLERFLPGIRIEVAAGGDVKISPKE